MHCNRGWWSRSAMQGMSSLTGIRIVERRRKKKGGKKRKTRERKKSKHNVTPIPHPYILIAQELSTFTAAAQLSHQHSHHYQACASTFLFSSSLPGVHGPAFQLKHGRLDRGRPMKRTTTQPPATLPPHCAGSQVHPHRCR